MARGFACIAIDVSNLLEPEDETGELARVLRLALAELNAGRNVILHTALGPNDTRLLGTKQGNTAAFQERLGICLGRLLREAILRSSVRRAVICGGDTSARAGSQLGVFAVTTLKPLSPGSPLCRAWSEEPRFDGFEIVFKGGQVGGEDFFGVVKQGG
jgi:uncharacterized protein YgbK (DUF1537 family)